VPHQNDIATTKIMKKAGRAGQGRKFFLQTPKSKIDKNHSYAICPYKNNNHIFSCVFFFDFTYKTSNYGNTIFLFANSKKINLFL
jgi:hypothetical protein